MSEVLLQSIIEKLEAIEIALLKENNSVEDETIQKLLKEIKSFQTEMAKLPLQFKISCQKISDLLKSITALNFRLDNPSTAQIKHSHHLHKDVWIAVGLFIFCIFFLYEWINCYNETNAFKANDIKYRYLKVNANSDLLKAIYSTDSLYNLNKDSFVMKVAQKEKDFVNQYELRRIADEKKKISKPPKIFRRSNSKN